MQLLTVFLWSLTEAKIKIQLRKLVKILVKLEKKMTKFLSDLHQLQSNACQKECDNQNNY